MKKNEFYFDSRDGETKIHAIMWVPDEPPVCILQIVHGMAEYIERYSRLAESLVKAGVLVTGEDHLGHGFSRYQDDKAAEAAKLSVQLAESAGADKEAIASQLRSEHPFGYFCRYDPATVVVRDVHRLKKMVQEQYPGVPYFILGHSMGSFILRNYLCQYGTGINGAIVMGTGMQPAALVKFGQVLAKILTAVQGPKHVSRLMNRIAFGNYTKRIENPVSGNAWLTRDEEEVRKYDADPLCGFTFTLNGFTTLFELIDRANQTANLEKMPRELPVLLVAGKEDPVGNWGKASGSLEERFDLLGMTRVRCRIYPGMRHELVNETGHEEVEKDILKWINEVRSVL